METKKDGGLLRNRAYRRQQPCPAQGAGISARPRL